MEGSSRSPLKDPRTIARDYQLELCKKAVEENLIVHLGTGCGKTHIAVLLMYELGHLILKPSRSVCVFLAPTVPLVQQQALVIETSTNFKVSSYFGKCKRLKDHADWDKEIDQFEVLVMTPQILLHNLQHCFIRMEHIALLIFDECHHAQVQSRHPYAQIMKEFYKTNTTKNPRIFGMTATPIVGKGGLSQLGYSRCINSLENLLDAKICSVDDSRELENFAATPDIKIFHYGPVTNHTSGFIVTRMQKLEEIKDQCICMMREQCDDFEECHKKIKNLQRIHENLIFCLENIGLQGALYAAKILLTADCNDLMQMELDISDKVGCIADHYLKKAYSVLKFEVLHDDAESDLTSLEALEEPLFSKKLIVLIGMLSTYRLRSDAKCIIFVERVLLARSLAYIIGNLKPLDFWKCEFLVGCHSGLRSMSRRKMNAIVEEFSLGKVNLLVATNVAEEGLDIQTCCLVVRFDWPKTVSSFIQSRGRARMRKSEYVFLLERGNERDEELLKSFLTKECVMNKEITSRTSVESFDDLEEKIYKVYSTGASVSTGCSISLLHHYCAKLPRDMYFTPQPKFYYVENPDGTTCRVILPPNAALRLVDSYPCSSKDEAKRLASLQACIALHERGALSDYLLPGHGKGMKKANSSECEDDGDDYLREELHEMLVPAALREQWSDSETHVPLHFYEIKFIPIPEDRPYRRFGLVVKCPLPKEAEAMEVDLHLAHGRIVKTSFISFGVLTFSREEITLAQKFQEMFLKVILDRSEFFSDVVLLGSNLESQVCLLTFYLLLPVKQCADGTSVVIDWHTIRRCLSSPAFGYQVNSCGMGHVPTDDVLELFNGPIKKVDVLGSLIFTPHNKQFFFIDGIVDDIDANSRRKGPKDISNSQHYKERFGIQLKYPDQPFLKAKQLFALRNLLHNRIQESTVVRETEEHFDVIPPELCCLKIVGFSKDIGSSLSLLPSWMHRLQNLLVALELKDVLSRSVREASEISGDCILEALTTEKCLERFSLERFEVLGDAFLKYAVGRHSFLSLEGLDEGQLTRKRSGIVNNSNLYDLAIKNNLQVYICDESFEPSQFFALGRPCMVPCEIDTKSTTCYRRGKDMDVDVAEAHKFKCSKSHRWLHQKRIADVVEALVGAFLVESGFRAATAFLRWVGIQVDFEILDVRRVLSESKVNMSLIGKIDVPALEESLGYEFLHKGLLLQAFVHPSYQKHSGGCYQNLEFLGDAVMEYLVTSYLYSVYPHLKPGQLTDLRSITVNNNSLALTAVQQFFHLYLLKDSSSLTQAINEFVRYVHASEAEQEQLEEPSFPKVLSDIVESCIGAILLDSGFNLELVWKIMLKLLNPILSFSSLKLNSVRELRELCQYKNFELRFPDPEKVGGDYLVRIEIHVNGEPLSFTATNHSSKVARRMAALEALQELKARGYRHKSKSLGEIVQSTHKKEAQLIGYDEECVVIDPSDLLGAENLVLSNSTKTPLDLDWQEEQIAPPSIDNSHHGHSNLSMWTPRESSAHTDRLQNNSHDPAFHQQMQQDIGISNDFTVTIGKKSARSKLYEICAGNYWNRPEFVCCNQEGPAHLKMFTSMVSVKADGTKSVLLECVSDPKPQKKAAEEDAAQGALWCLNHLGYLPKQ